MAINVDGNAGVTLTYVPLSQFSGADEFRYTITDDREGSSSSYVNISVVPANDPPVAVNDSQQAIEDTPLVISLASLLANDSDVDGDPLRIISVTVGAHGSVELSNGAILFTPDHNFDGAAWFEYTITDDADGIDTARVNVNVLSTNRAPTIVADSFTGTEDIPYIVSAAELVANDFDIDGDDFSFVAVDQNGVDGNAFLLPDGRWALTPEGDHTGIATFTYRITDGRGLTIGTNQISVDFLPVNDAPTARNEGGYVTVEEIPLEISLAELLANDSDTENDPLTVIGVLDPVNGSIALSDGKVIFTPRTDYFGNGGFSYRISDGNGGTDIGVVTLSVLPAQDLPFAVSDSGWTIDEDSFVLIQPSELTANDFDADGDPIVFVGASGAGVTTLADGTIRFEPGNDDNGTFTLRYTINDGNGADVQGTFSVFVRPVNDTPIAVDDAFSGTEDQPVIIPISQLVANDRDPDGNAISLTSILGAIGGSAVLDSIGNVVFTPDANRNGQVSFEYRLTDSTNSNDTATALIDLRAVNDAPEIASFGPLSGIEDTRVAVQIPLAAFSDIDGDSLSLTVRGQGGAALPSWLIFDPVTRGLFGQPPLDFAGSVNLEVVANDGTVDVVRSFQIAIANVNDAPAAQDDLVESVEHQPIVIPVLSLLSNDTDVDGDTLAITAVAGIGGAVAELDGLGNIRVTPASDTSGNPSFSYTVGDGLLSDTAVVTVSVTQVNDAPVLSPVLAKHAPEDGVIDITLPAGIATDQDGDALTYSAFRAGGLALPAWLAFDAQTLKFTGTPPADFNGTVNLRLAVSDGQLSDFEEFSLIIDPVSDAPRISAPFSDRSVNEDALFDITLQSGLFSDIDGDSLTYSLALADGSALPAWINAQPQLLRMSGRAPENFNGSIDVRVTASDGALSQSDVFRLTVNPVNDAPVLNTPLLDKTVTTGAPFTINIPSGTFSDPDGDALQFSATLASGAALPAWMTFDGSKLTGTAPFNTSGTMDVKISASDGSLQNADVFQVSFLRGNAAPVAVADGPFSIRSGAPLTILNSQLLANDTDADGDALSIVGHSQAAHGSVTMNANGTFTYLTAGGYVGNDQFIYALSDGKETVTATVSVSVGAAYTNVQSGGTGNDALLGSVFGDSYLSGGNGNDTLISLFGNDFLSGGNGNDTLIAGSGADILDGGNGNDTLIAGSGNDELRGGAGSDTLFGGAGQDTFLFRSGDGSDQIGDFQATRRTRASVIQGDHINLDIDGINNYNDLLAHAQQQNGGVLLDFGNGDQLFLSGTKLAALDKDSFTFF